MPVTTHTLTALVQVMQVLAGVAWMFPMFAMAPPVWRVWIGRASALDVLGSPMFFVAAVQVGFSLRWVIWPHSLPEMGHTELSVWGGLYILSIIAALAVLAAWHFGKPLR